MTEHKLSPLFTWRSAIADSDLPPVSRLVALTLSLHMNERGGSCFPAVATLARESGLSERAVQQHLRALEDAGWLVCVQRGGGRGRTSVWSSAIPKGRTTNGESETVNLASKKGESDDAKGCTSCTRGRQEDDKESVILCAPEARASLKRRDFDEWWELYPLKRGKGAAEKAYGKARKRATRDEILGGLRRLRDELAAEMARGFCPYPATWLNQDRWKDEPKPRRAAPRQTGPTLPRGADSLMRVFSDVIDGPPSRDSPPKSGLNVVHLPANRPPGGKGGGEGL